jgi:threonine dehydrogenase-like Zn-dependent dehydrogenase
MLTDTTAQVRAGGRLLELRGPEELVVTERPRPRALPGHVVVDVATVGICGTDLHAYRGRSARFPVVPGHDLAGSVAELGEGVGGFRIGERVTIDPTIACGICAACTRGLRAVCPAGGYLGMNLDGVMAEAVLVPAEQVVALPETVSDIQATVLEPVVVALRVMERTARFVPEPAQHLVIGGGPIGVLLAIVLRSHGHDVIVVEPLPGRRAAAERLGVTTATPDSIVTRALPPGPRVISETSASIPGFELAVALATPGSALAVVGRSGGVVPAAAVLLSELAVIGIRGGPGLYPDAIRSVAEGTFDPAGIVTHHFDLDEGPAAFARATEHPDDVHRAVLHFPRAG